MTEGKAEFVRKLRRVIKVLMWIWMIGSFVFFWGFEKYASQFRMATGSPMGQPSVTPSAEAIEAAKRMDWGSILLPWVIFGIAPVLVLGLILYLMPGGKKKTAAPRNGSGGD
jgi:hypothetical protein